MGKFHKLLIANRGEIAARIIRTARHLGYQTVAVHSEADRDAPHLALADEAVFIGPSRAAESYLKIDAILEAARETGADAVHPGYGFLSENDSFARACAEAELVFIGPPAKAIKLMGNKRAAKEKMLKAGVPCVPGYHGRQDDRTLIAEAKQAGFPLMVKAAAGGGGRGMRIAQDEAALKEALQSARREAKNAFGNDELILEKAILNGRHVEIQVARDSQGRGLYLGERDCSAQRRHQKVLEEAPAPHFGEALRRQMGEAAVKAAEACDYEGLGTVEFLLGEDGAFYFLEMNTRLQVEHPVSEMVLGEDLVAWQLAIANGEALPLAQEEVALNGHAIEARLYAENPAKNFMPQTGQILLWREPEGDGVRADHGVQEGFNVSPFYDPMLAKIIAHGRTRDEAIRRLIRALKETRLLGVQTNKAFLISLLSESAFQEGRYSTSFIDDSALERAAAASAASAEDLALMALLVQQDADDDERGFHRWSNSADLRKRAALQVGDETHQVFLRKGEDSQILVSIGESESEHRLAIHQARDGRVLFSLDGVRQSAFFARSGRDIYLDRGARALRAEDRTYAPALLEEKGASGRIVATTEGQIVSVAVKVGASVRKGQTLLTIEAMKMEHRLAADGDGAVKALHAKEGMQVKKGDLMAELELNEEGGA